MAMFKRYLIVSSFMLFTKLICCVVSTSTGLVVFAGMFECVVGTGILVVVCVVVVCVVV